VSPRPLILASASPRRRDLLAQHGIAFEVAVATDAEPCREPGEPCESFALRAAVAKAAAVAPDYPRRPVLGADTIVVIDDEVLGKPGGPGEAREMLKRLSGRTHQVQTGVAVVEATPGGVAVVAGEVAISEVTFRSLSDREIEQYVATGEPLDKAGAYGIQGRGGELVASFAGSYSNIVGLPMELVKEMLAGPEGR